MAKKWRKATRKEIKAAENHHGVEATGQYDVNIDYDNPEVAETEDGSGFWIRGWLWVPTEDSNE